MQQALLASDRKAPSFAPESRRWLLMTVGIAAALLAALAGTSYLRFGSLSAGLDYLRGERLILDSRVKDFGEFNTENERTLVFKLANLTGQPVRILGARSACTCVRVQQLPMTIPLSANAELKVTVRKGRKFGDIRESIQFYTDSPEKPDLFVKLIGRIPE